jgi:hypothetical protein
MSKRTLYIISIAFLAVLFWLTVNRALDRVIREEGKTYLVDRTGERWDVTQAESIGFKPERFQYGLGRHAFTPLDDSHLSDGTGDVPQNLRVLGVAEDSQARAYSIGRLRRHEVANSKIGSKPIAVTF